MRILLRNLLLLAFFVVTLSVTSQTRAQGIEKFIWLQANYGAQGGYQDEKNWYIAAKWEFSTLTSIHAGQVLAGYIWRPNDGWFSLQPSIGSQFGGSSSGVGSLKASAQLYESLSVQASALAKFNAKQLLVGGTGNISWSPLNKQDFRISLSLNGEGFPNLFIFDTQAQAAWKFKDCKWEISVSGKATLEFWGADEENKTTWWGGGQMGLWLGVWKLPGPCRKKQTLF